MQRPALIVSLIVTMLLIAGALVFVTGRSDRGDLSAQLMRDLNVPFQPLVPGYLPAGARLLSVSDQSLYSAETQMLTVRWVFPAQTLPGQGTLILHQADNTVSFMMPVVPEKTVTVNGVEASLGALERVSGLEPPGQRALSFRASGHQIVLVSYAISDDELIKIAESIK